MNDVVENGFSGARCLWSKLLVEIGGSGRFVVTEDWPLWGLVLVESNISVKVLLVEISVSMKVDNGVNGV